MRKVNYIIVLLIGLVCVACKPTTNTSALENTAGGNIDIQNDSTTITIYSPWQKRSLSSGANDFWESGVVHPERILQDLQKVLQGDTTDLFYMSPLAH